MKSLNFFRSVSAWGHILFAILRVLTIIGAVFTVIGIFTFSLLPRDFFSIDVSMQTDMKFNFKALLGENWSEIVKDAEDVVYDSLPDGSKLTEDGIEISEITPSTTVRGKMLALEMIPAFTQMLISIALFHYLCKIFKALKIAAEPFAAPITEDLRYAGGILMALGAVPALSAGLIRLLTKTESISADVTFDLWLIFCGFLLWAVSDLFLYAKSRLFAAQATPSTHTPPAEPSDQTPPSPF